MSNLEVIKSFLVGKKAQTPLRNINGVYIWQGRTLQTDGKELINYKTKIAYKNGIKLYITKTKYSQTTSKIISQLLSEAKTYEYEIIRF